MSPTTLIPRSHGRRRPPDSPSSVSAGVPCRFVPSRRVDNNNCRESRPFAKGRNRGEITHQREFPLFLCPSSTVSRVPAGLSGLALTVSTHHSHSRFVVRSSRRKIGPRIGFTTEVSGRLVHRVTGSRIRRPEHCRTGRLQPSRVTYFYVFRK